MILDSSVTSKSSIETYTTLESRFIDLHGEHRFDYTNSIYKNMKTPIEIKCNICGNILYKTPDAHLNKNNTGCIHCSKKYKPKLNEFIAIAQSIHNYKFNYDEFTYINKDTPSTIKCNECGFIFKQSPHNHIYHKKGCKKCAARSKRNRYYNEPTSLYYIEFVYDGIKYYKIGITKNNILKRFRSDKKYFSRIIFSKSFETGKLAFELEQKILTLYYKYKAQDVSFLRGGNSELFSLDIGEYIEKYFI